MGVESNEVEKEVCVTVKEPGIKEKSVCISSAKEPYKRAYILQKRPVILRSLLIVATPYLKSGVSLSSREDTPWE